MTYVKIDQHGHYCPFPGLTIIANTKKEDGDFWNTIYDAIKELHTDYFSVLPPSSYHMTTTNLVTAAQFPNEELWNKFIQDKLFYFNQLSQHLSQETHPLNITFNRLITNGVIQLEVNLHPSQKADIQRFASLYGIDQRLIPIHFHITLAYQYKPLPQNEYLKVANNFKNALEPIFSEQMSIQLLPPELSYFLDMTDFHSWDGSENPFPNDNTYSVKLG